MICNEKNQSIETDSDMIEIMELIDKDIKNYYDIFHVVKKEKNMSILRYGRYFLKFNS